MKLATRSLVKSFRTMYGNTEAHKKHPAVKQIRRGVASELRAAKLGKGRKKLVRAVHRTARTIRERGTR